MNNDFTFTDLHKSILKNAEKLRQLYALTKMTAEERGTREYPSQKWTTPLQELHATYSDLCFPGGEDNILCITAGDAAAMEAALCYLECRPYFHRSGYLFQIILKYAKRAPLSQPQKLRLQAVIDKRDAWRRNLPDLLRAQADKGDAAALGKLAELYFGGYKYVPSLKRNTAEGMKLLRMAAERDDPNAQETLSLYYSYGLYIPKNWAEAYFWASLAARHMGDKHRGSARRRRQESAENMTSEEKAIIDARVKAWTPVS